MKKKRSLSVVIFIASLLLAVTLMDTWILYNQTHIQTTQSGAYQLESVSGKLESTISDAKNLSMELAIEAREYLRMARLSKPLFMTERASFSQKT